MLEKALNRLARRNYYNRSQYPEIFFEIEETITTLRTWIQTYQIFSGLFTFTWLLSIYIKELNELIGKLIIECKPLHGKKGVKKSSLVKEEKNLCNSIDSMLKHIKVYLDKTKRNETIISRELEKSLFKAFETHCRQEHEKKIRFSVSTRGGNTYVFPWAHKGKYLSFIYDRKRFKTEVVDKLGGFIHATGHLPSCKGPKKYDLAGFRSNNRKTVTEGGKEEEFPIPMVKCVNCHKSFSLLPSFLPREKHFEIDIIGTVVKNIVLFSQSLQGAIEMTQISGRKVKSKQTILNWLRWFGTLHPATVLTRAGIKGSGYFQEDEGFEKEPELRTYTVSMIEPESLLLWHVDYIDHVDEETLCDSFEKFAERIDFKVLGVTKDKWKPSTNALKKVFHNLWLGFCHLHCLKKFRNSLSEYQKETGCSLEKINKLYT